LNNRVSERDADAVYEELGVRRVVNAAGIYTDLGGSVLSPGVRAAVNAVNGAFAAMPELLERTGAYLAELVGAPAARVVPGASAGIALSVGACMTRAEGPLMEQLPDTAGMRSGVLMQRGHHYKYDRCARMTGAELVECPPDEAALDAALAGEIACVLHPAHLDGTSGTLPLETVAGMAHAHGVPVVVDAAYMSYPTELIPTYGTRGGDLVCFSAKYFWGPNAGGFVYGAPELVQAVAGIDFTGFESGRHRIFGRAFKLDRSAVVGTVLALREWLELDHDARWASYRARGERLAGELRDLAGAEPGLAQFTLDERLVPERPNSLVLDLAGPHAGRADEFAGELAAGDPSIVCVPLDGKLVFCLETVAETDEQLLLERIREALGR
jgi:L-seryl-tRNA(Ser) seleniumtransferase